MSYDYTDSQDTGDPDNDDVVMDDTGDFLQQLLGGGTQVLSSVLGGGNGKPGQGIGAGIGALAGAGLGTLAGGAGAGIGAALGKAAGGAVEKLVRTQTAKKKPAKKPAAKQPAQHPKRTRVPTKRERKMLAEAEQKAKRTGQTKYVEEAHLRVYRPAEYKRKRDAGLLWSQVYEQNEFDDAPESEFDESPDLEDSNGSYDEAAAPETRPQPRRHISTVPLTGGNGEAAGALFTGGNGDALFAGAGAPDCPGSGAGNAPSTSTAYFDGADDAGANGGAYERRATAQIAGSASFADDVGFGWHCA
jgi:hypothetical protein